MVDYHCVKKAINEMWKHVNDLNTTIIYSDESEDYKAGYLSALCDWYDSIETFDYYVKECDNGTGKRRQD